MKIISRIVICMLLISASAHLVAQKKVMVFGCFDLFHEGHKNFLEQAANHGTVIAIVTRDTMIETLKKRSPCQAEEVRLKHVQEFWAVAIAILGDAIMGTYSALKEYKPDLICLGYDQQGLFNDLKKRMSIGQLPQIEMIFLQPYQEDIYHTSLIRKKISCIQN